MGSIGPTELVVLAIFLGLVAAVVVATVLVVRSVTRKRAPQLPPPVTSVRAARAR